MNNIKLNIIYKVSNTNLFKIQYKDIIDMEIDSLLINDSEHIDTNLFVYNNISFNDELMILIYEYFSNKSKLSIYDFIDKIKAYIINNDDIYLDLSKCNFTPDNIRLFKAIFVFIISVFPNVCISDELYHKLNIDNDLHYFIKDITLFRKYIDPFSIKDIELLIYNNNILVYKIHNIHYLFNVNPVPVKFELPITMQNKTYYSVMCNNDKYLRDVLIIGKNHFFVFEEIE